jgi:hypothetical protein
MAIDHVPPHIFDALYRYYKFGHHPGDCLNDMIHNRPYTAALRADALTKKHFADIFLFINEHARGVPASSEVFNLRWETWRCKFSPDAQEIDFDRGDDE